MRSEAAVRSAMYLARDHGRDDLREALRGLARNARQDGLRGIAAAALFDLGERADSLPLADELVKSRQLGTATWGALLRAAGSGALDRIVTETTYRRLHLGWVE
jgi:hypothetical protein